VCGVEEAVRSSEEEEGMSTKWTHAICNDCWDARNPNGRTPHRLKDPEPEYCCFCNEPTISGIYVRSDPEKTPCKGQGGRLHEEDG